MTKTSIGVQDLQQRIGEKAKADPQHRFWGLYTHVWKLDILEAAYRLAQQNNGAPGVDGVTFAEIEAQGVQEFLQQLSDELRTKTYRPLPCRQVTIPKADGGERVLKIPAIRDRVVQGALRLVTEPIFEADFQDGSFGYRPLRTAHQALARVRNGLYAGLQTVLDLDLKSYVDTVRHDLLLAKLARRIQDDEVLWLSKVILKAGGKRGLPQGSVIGPLWANVFLTEIDLMLEKAQVVTQRQGYQNLRYTRFADDLVVLVDSHPRSARWVELVERRLREELTKLDLTVNEAKSRRVFVGAGETFDFLGYTFRWVQRNGKRKPMVLCRPQKKKRTRFLRELGQVMKRNLSLPVAQMIKEVVNPRVRGWVGYFRWGNPSADLSFVREQVELKVRRFASRQRPKRQGGCGWSTWSKQTIYGTWKLFNDYRVAWCSVPSREVT